PEPAWGRHGEDREPGPEPARRGGDDRHLAGALPAPPGPVRRAARRGPAVFLRRPTARDREELIRPDRASRRLHRGLAWPPVTRRQFADYLKRRHRPDSPGFLICRVVDGAIVGGINVSEIVRGNFRSAYLGYQIGEPFARRGYMTEALPLALRF